MASGHGGCPGVEAPLQFVALDDQGAGDEAVPVAQGGVADVDQEGVAVAGRFVRGPCLDPFVVRADPLQQLVYAGRLFAYGAHCQSSGRSTCSRRSTGPVRL